MFPSTEHTLQHLNTHERTILLTYTSKSVRYCSTVGRYKIKLSSSLQMAGCLMALNAKHLVQVACSRALKAVRVAILCVMHAMVQVRKTALVAVK